MLRLYWLHPYPIEAGRWLQQSVGVEMVKTYGIRYEEIAIGVDMELCSGGLERNRLVPFPINLKD